VALPLCKLSEVALIDEVALNIIGHESYFVSCPFPLLQFPPVNPQYRPSVPTFPCLAAHAPQPTPPDLFSRVVTFPFIVLPSNTRSLLKYVTMHDLTSCNHPNKVSHI
jgi:hypothetical protein